jgi:hypothetical protein
MYFVLGSNQIHDGRPGSEIIDQEFANGILISISHWQLPLRTTMSAENVVLITGASGFLARRVCFSSGWS